MSTETELALYTCPDYTMLPILTKLIDGYIKRQVAQRFPYLEETANHRSCLLQRAKLMARVNLPPCWTGCNGWRATAMNVNYCRVGAHLWHAELVKRRRK